MEKINLITMGRHSYGTPEILVWARNKNKVIVGNYTSIAKGCKILLNGEHNTDWISTYPFRKFKGISKQAAKIIGHPKSKGDVIIGSDVWIGRDVTILSGLRIGDGAVIGARAVITKDVAPYAIVGGNPAKLIRKRFTDSQIKQLLEIKWWNWPEVKVMENISIISCNDIDGFIKKHGNKN